jgi:hypothetical protein
VLIFSLALVVVEFLAILPFFNQQKLQNISWTQVATWRQKLAADFPSLQTKNVLQNMSETGNFIFLYLRSQRKFEFSLHLLFNFQSL